MISYIKFGIMCLLPGIVACILFELSRTKLFKGMTERTRQIIYGVVFGGLAVLGTEIGIPINGAQCNCRDAAVMTAGLLFGAPAGIIAGLIGGIERWFAVYWGIGTFTRVGCTVSTIVAGFYSAYLREKLLEERKPVLLVAFVIGAVMEIFHMTTIFIFRLNYLEKVMDVLNACAIPMTIGNAFAVTLATFLLAVLEKSKFSDKMENVSILKVIQLYLMITILCAFVISSVFVYALQTSMARNRTAKLLSQTCSEITQEIENASDQNMIQSAYNIARVMRYTSLEILAENGDISDINVIDEDGIIIKSNVSDYVGYDMMSTGQSKRFMEGMRESDEFVQSYGPIGFDRNVKRKYAGVRVDEGYLQIGYDASQIQAEIAYQVADATKFRRIESTGYALIFDQGMNVVSSPDGRLDFDAETIFGEEMPQENKALLMDINEESCYAYLTSSEGYYILAVLPEKEAKETLWVTVYSNTFMEVLVFALLFAQIFMLIRRIVIDRLRRVNVSLSRIAAGDLTEVVRVHSNEEFSQLSQDINATVDTLKRYIAEANARIDEELKIAKNIQSGALPKPRENLTNRRDLEVDAFMATAKEVGGDFYDFYMTDKNRFNFMIADVSGKGIPAAMFMMRSKTELKNMTEAGYEIDDVFSRSNDHLCTSNDEELFVTAWQGCLDLDTGEVTFVNAGHNQPLWYHDGQFRMLDTHPNFVLGGMEGLPYMPHTLKMDRGDILFLYTDGVTEATNGENELYGDDRLLDFMNTFTFSSMTDMCSLLKWNIDAFVGSAPQFDDITMLAIRYIGHKPDVVFHFDEVKTEDITGLTEQLEEGMAEIGVPMEMVVQFSIAVDEIYSNIVKFAYPESTGYCTVTLHEDVDPHAVTLIFEDAGKPFNPLTKSDPDTTLSAEERIVGGLGMLIVKEFMDILQYRYEDGKNIFTIGKKLPDATDEENE